MKSTCEQYIFLLCEGLNVTGTHFLRNCIRFLMQ